MGLNVFHDSDEGTGFVVGIVAIPICVFATFLRFVSTSRAGRTLGLEDWFALLALLAFLAYTGLDLWTLRKLNGKNLFQLGEIPIPTLIEIYKVGYGMNIQTALNQTFAKLSLLALYYRIFFISRGFVFWCFSIGGIQIAWCIAMVLIRLFLCRPVAAAYNPTIKHAKCLNSQVLLAAGDSINSAIDFIMVGMAIWMIYKLKMSNGAKLKLSILFALGGFSGVIGIIKIAEAYGNVGSNVRDATWNIAQQGTSILCCCAPIYKSLLQELHIFRRLGLTFLYGSKGDTQYGKKSSEASSATDKNGTRGKNWLPLDGSSSQRQLAWVEANAGAGREHSYPMRAVNINRSVEMV
ncbi:hypothetical protein G7Y89_g12848 [Cudoniella acicularis]|uniref:Rhodopsin domain-containing protein n=1 Tax=Cudoniella acicularis TaxID=354080 RepID=A0A8H4VYS5_9HELO|nr:hypothetical protein G7Y89_g12848 [Cudoniella acicularis]